MTAKKVTVRRKKTREVPAATLPKFSQPAFLAEENTPPANRERFGAEDVSRDFERDSRRYAASLEVALW